MSGIAALLVLAAIAVPEGLSLFRQNRGETIIVPDAPFVARYLVIALLGLGVVIYVILQFSYASDRRAAGADQYRRPGWPFALFFVVLLAFWAASPGFQSAVRDLLERGDRSGRSGASAEEDPTLVPPQREESKALGIGLTAILVVLVVSSAAVVRILVTPDRLKSKTDRDEALARAIEAGIEDLESIADPRAAVIACYGGMLAFAEAAGFERDLSDTPSQALIRLFNAVRVDRAEARRLTELFERAKFSQHPVDDEMRREATAILGRIRESLAVPV
ncbi:MAG: DUF4129 domain-containing protein [Actinobacteria bacterium]|nr:DUF4129 domain-containing protein [Actinomycetota bacterium]